MAGKGITFRMPFDAPAPSVKAAERPVQRVCETCGAPASFGFGVRLRAGVEGRWFCGKHRHDGEGER